MLTLVLLSLAIAGQDGMKPPPIPAGQPPVKYPVHLHIVDARWTIAPKGYHGLGHATILTPGQRALKFESTCSQSFAANLPKAEFYPARWKVPERELEVQVEMNGSTKLATCTLETSLAPVVAGGTAAAAKVPGAVGGGGSMKTRPTF